MSKNKGTGFYLFYADGCTPTIRRFSTAQDRLTFIANFYLEHGGNEDYWIDALVDGQVQVVKSSGISERDLEVA